MASVKARKLPWGYVSARTDEALIEGNSVKDALLLALDDLKEAVDQGHVTRTEFTNTKEQLRVLMENIKADGRSKDIQAVNRALQRLTDAEDPSVYRLDSKALWRKDYENIPDLSKPLSATEEQQLARDIAAAKSKRTGRVTPPEYPVTPSPTMASADLPGEYRAYQETVYGRTGGGDRYGAAVGRKDYVGAPRRGGPLAIRSGPGRPDLLGSEEARLAARFGRTPEETERLAGQLLRTQSRKAGALRSRDILKAMEDKNAGQVEAMFASQRKTLAGLEAGAPKVAPIAAMAEKTALEKGTALAKGLAGKAGTLAKRAAMYPLEHPFKTGLGAVGLVWTATDMMEAITNRDVKKEQKEFERQVRYAREERRSALEGAKLQWQLEQSAQEKALALSEKNPSLAQIMMGLPDMTPNEAVFGARPNPEGLLEYMRLDALAKGEVSGVPSTGLNE